MFNLVRSLRSLERVSGLPLYTMTYYGGYAWLPQTERALALLWKLLGRKSLPAQAPGGVLFTAETPTGHRLLARNFPGGTEQPGPALLLYMAPPEGNASLSLVPLEALGFGAGEDLLRGSLACRLRLALAPLLPGDGLNEYGLAVACAALPPDGQVTEPGRQALPPALARRRLLDQATNPEEALKLLTGGLEISLRRGNVLFFAGDEGGASGVVTYAGRQARVQPNLRPWQVAGDCADEVEAQLAAVDGVTKVEAAMRILQSVAEADTDWSVVYVLTTGDVFVVMRRQYEVMHRFHLTLRA